MPISEIQKSEGQLHPENLTSAQERLADLYAVTKVEAKVRRRRTLPDGKFELYEIIRPIGIFDFAQEDEFALKGHEKNIEDPLSPYYINQRNLPEHVYDQIGQVLAEISTDKKPDFCTGVPEAGTNIARAYANAAGVPFVEEIFAKEDTKAGGKIVGKIKAGGKNKLRLIDDLVTGANSILEAIRVAEALGYEVLDVMVIIDREEGGARQLIKRRIKLYTAFKVTQLFDYYLRTGIVNKEKYNESKAYLASRQQAVAL